MLEPNNTTSRLRETIAACVVHGMSGELPGWPNTPDALRQWLSDHKVFMIMLFGGQGTQCVERVGNYAYRRFGINPPINPILDGMRAQSVNEALSRAAANPAMAAELLSEDRKARRRDRLP